MVKEWRSDADFTNQTFFRAFGVTEVACSSVADQITASATIDDALFAEEKQNLYLDDAREIKLWSQVILNVSAYSIKKRLISRLARWVSDGIDVLIAKTVEKIDGALGWSSTPEVFTLGLQVICGAEIMLHIVDGGMKIPIRPSTLRMKLAKLSAAAALQDINPLWRKEIDRVLNSAVTGKLRWCMMVMDRLSPCKPEF